MPVDLSKLCAETLFAEGLCTVPNCPKRRYHAARFCELCAAICFSPQAYAAHVGGSTHRRRTEATAKGESATWMHCTVCDIQVLGSTVWKEHLLGGPHARRSARQGVAPEDVQPALPPGDRYKRCALCKEAVPNHRWSHHLFHIAHKRREEHALLRSVFERAEDDKCGITVSHTEAGLDFGIVSVADATEGVQAEISVSTTIPSSCFRVERADVSAPVASHILP